MGKFHEQLDDNLRGFIDRQHMFFVASAPREGRVNLSPKGLDSLRILDAKRVVYLDMTGSGNETAAHLLENGRMTLMFCSFEGDPLILRLYGKGQVVARHDPDWEAMRGLFPAMAGVRHLVVLDIESLQTSCGAGVPLYDYQGEREALLRWVEKKGEDGALAYRLEKNRVSIDGLPTGLID